MLNAGSAGSRGFGKPDFRPLDVDGLMEFIEEGAKIEENETEPEFNFDLDLEEEMEDGEF